ncbi:uncharacterized protein MONBRDRAFT_5528 [Monosiga brevicollis MX1]|uniref:Uncharacterized protein n=1 Tax=Monosiga brevicollis TaxID=81824 RepID=A9URQ4_MONBE|nr:uncharacterized protein MONBRDRAFT_5528 [Monosiga brevicollis MX1]EDQ91646.1 predicted protein [Monosiga brevicollis MX1]|eukprot:XP_001742932.1 hypothetical protein [Monosiga brevicollis MX1]
MAYTGSNGLNAASFAMAQGDVASMSSYFPPSEDFFDEGALSFLVWVSNPTMRMCTALTHRNNITAKPNQLDFNRLMGGLEALQRAASTAFPSGTDIPVPDISKGKVKREPAEAVGHPAAKSAHLAMGHPLGSDDRLPQKRSTMARGVQRGVEATNASRKLCAIWLNSDDINQCRFAVKNDEKADNRILSNVQSQGYVEYKARYCKKRGQSSGYGSFHVAFLPVERAIYPLQRLGAEESQHIPAPVDDAVLYDDQVNVENFERVIITVRLYQSYRGSYPTRVYRFSEDEEYQQLFVSGWQDATMMVRNGIDGITVEADESGDCIHYIVHKRSLLEQFNSEKGIHFPCPIPASPEKMNDIGMLRMQVSVTFYLRDSTPSPDARFVQQGLEMNVWLRIKIVQQLSGRKKRYAFMRLDDDDEYDDATPLACLPPRPLVKPIDMDGGSFVRYTVGSEGIRGNSVVHMLRSIADTAAKTIIEEQALGEDRAASSTALHAACAEGDIGITFMLLQSQPTLIHALDEHGNTPMHCAARHGHMPIVTLLFDSGARVECVNAAGEVPYDVASTSTVRDYLLQQVQKERTHGCSSLLRAAATGCWDSLCSLINAGHDVNGVNAQGHTPLFLAVEHNQPIAVYTLLQAGADPLRRNRHGLNSIHLAAKRGDPETLVILLHHRPDATNEQAADGRTALHFAAELDHVLCVQILLSCGCDITAIDNSGDTAMGLASRRKNPDVELLLMTRSHQQMDERRASQLFRKCREGGSLHIAAIRGDVALARKLLQEGADLKLRDSRGNTALHHAARNGRFLVLDELLNEASRINEATNLVHAQVDDGRNALHLACNKDSISSAIVLLSRKLGDLHASAKNGDTALHSAARNGQVCVAALLLLGGLDPRTANMTGMTAHQIALAARHPSTAQVLSANTRQLQELSKMLANPPNFPVETSLERAVDHNLCIHWSDLGNLLSRMWHATHNACVVLRSFRAAANASGQRRGSNVNGQRHAR